MFELKRSKSSTDDMPPGMAELTAAGLLHKVLSNLSNLCHILTCATVSKSWNTTVKLMRLRHLSIRLAEFEFGQASCVQLRRWLMEQLKNGTLADLTKFELNANQEKLLRYKCEEDSEAKEISNLYATVVTALAVTRLQTCCLSDAVKFEDAAELLPVSIQELQLNYSKPDHCSYQAEYAHLDQDRDCGSVLASFKRFSNLQKLSITFGDYHVFHDGYDCTVHHRLDKLRHLEIHDAAFCLKEGCSLPELFSNLETMVVCVNLWKGHKPEELVSALLHHVPKLTLCLKGQCMFVPKSILDRGELVVTVAECSLLQRLCIETIYLFTRSDSGAEQASRGDQDWTGHCAQPFLNIVNKKSSEPCHKNHVNICRVL